MFSVVRKDRKQPTYPDLTDRKVYPARFLLYKFITDGLGLNAKPKSY